MKKAIYKFKFNAGRAGELEGLLISTKEKVDKLIECGIEVDFGEALGKHSEVYGCIDQYELTFETDNEEAVRIVEEHSLTIGYNPFEYYSVNFEMEGEDLDDVTVGEIVEKLLK